MLIGYARVSTKEQDTALQADALRAAGCEQIFEETASSGKARPKLDEALKFMRPQDTLVVWRLDRLARSIKELIETVEDLAARKIAFRSLTEEIDTTTATGQLTFHLFAAIAQFERNLLRERTNAGLAAAAKRGRKGGRRPALTPAQIDTARVLLKDPDISFTEVAARIGATVPTLYRSFPGGKTAVMKKAQAD